MKLLIITQAVDQNNPVLGFFHRWIEEFAKRAETIEVICLTKGEYMFPENVRVHSLGKEKGIPLLSRFTYAARFLHLVWKLRKNYDSVFVHMNQEYILLAGMAWKMLRKRVYMWRNHYAGSWFTTVAARFCEKVFYTSVQSYTARYANAVQMPVGVDTERFKPVAGVERVPGSILFFGRIAPSKRPEMLLEALARLSENNTTFTATLCGPGEPAYIEKLQQLVKEKGIEERVTFLPAISHDEAPALFSAHEIFVNCSPSGMFDKTILEAASCGCDVFSTSEDVRTVTPVSFFKNATELAHLLMGRLSSPSEAISTHLVQEHTLELLIEKTTKVLLGKHVGRVGLVLVPYGAPHVSGSPGAFAPFVEALVSQSPDTSFLGYIKGSVGAISNQKNLSYVPMGPFPTWLFGSFSIDRSLDAFLFMTPVIPIGFRARRTVVMVHDFAYLSLPERSLRERVYRPLLRAIQARSLRRAHAIIAVSEATKNEIVARFRISPEKIAVVHNGYTPSVPQELHAVPEQFFLFAGALKSRKNVARIIQAFALFLQETSCRDVKLLLTGNTKGVYYEELLELVTNLKLTHAVQFVGYVSDEELAFLYTRALALVFPSLCEGFGIPVLEAMARGCPVITSNTGALAEVAGNAALLVDPENEQAIAGAMRAFAENKQLRAEHSEKGRVRSRAFSWERSAKETLRLIEGI